MKYEDYHRHPLNKFIHFVCIPIIVLTSCNLLSKFRIKTRFTTLRMEEIATCIMLINYLISYGYTAYLVMCSYFFVIHTLSFVMRTNKNYIRDSLILFVLAWCAQFLGHAIEGSRPALLTSITQAFSEAPLFSVGYILPFKLTE